VFWNNELPRIDSWRYAPWPKPKEGELMEFRLVYDGWLPPAAQEGRKEEKHDIRRVFSRQLEVLFHTHPRLKRDREVANANPGGDGVSLTLGKPFKGLTHGAPDLFKRSGRNFLPLITGDKGIGCAIDILFLRRDPPGGVVKNSGDIDNRIKTLFDALRLPRNDSEVYGDPAGEPDPFYCLLEDDRLITDFSVTTDRLLLPVEASGHANDVRLIIHVRSVVLDPGNLGAITF